MPVELSIVNRGAVVVVENLRGRLSCFLRDADAPEDLTVDAERGSRADKAGD